MPSVRRAITAFWGVSIFLFSINVAISRFIEYIPVESPPPPPFSPNLVCVCVCVCGCVCGWVGGCASACQCE